MKKLTNEEILIRLSESTEKTGYAYSLTEDLMKVKVYCPLHDFSKLQNKNYAFSGRKISCCNTFSPITEKELDEYINDIRSKNPNCDIEIYGNFDGGSTNIRIYCKIHDHQRIIKYTSLRHKITEHACNMCSHEQYNRNFELSKDVWITRSKKVHGVEKYEYDNFEDSGINRTITCKKHGDFIQSIRNHVYYGNGCPKCVVPYSVSSYERVFSDWFETLGFISGVDFIKNDRSAIAPMELDFYFPKLKVGIEFNGDYWHSDLKKNRKYHQNKVVKGKEVDINVIMIYEHLWKSSSDLIKSRLKHILKISDNRIYARNTKVGDISYNIAKEFCETHHIQGMTKTSINYGLFFDNELVSVMTFGDSRFTKNEIELIRYCTKYSVIGGAGKLFKHFLKNNNTTNKILSYADLDWSNGNLYETLGFSYDGITQPSYVWVKGDIVKTRYQTQMKNENTIMRNEGFLKIYKSGSIRYTFNR